MATVLRPTRGWVSLDIVELFRFRDLLVALATRDVKLRYKQTLLGVGWVVIQPLAAAGLLYFAFAVVAGIAPPGAAPFLPFSFAGLLAWNVFSATLTKSSLSMVGNAYLVSKVYFPRLILPLSGSVSTLVDFSVSAVVLVALFAVYGLTPNMGLVLAPVWIALIVCLAMGLGLATASLVVRYRDVQHVLPMIVPFLLYASPVAYDISQIAPRHQQLFYAANPLAALIAAFRWSAMGTPLPPVPAIIWSTVFALGALAAGAAIFRRTERRFADVI